MPRWPDKENKLELVKPEEAEQEDKPALLPLPESVLHDKIDYLIQLMEEAKTPDPQDEVSSSHEMVKLQRRRTEDEMHRALSLLLSGQQRPRDDDSPQVIEDTINEVFALRKITMDLMQAMTTSYQTGLAAIRKMTER